MAYVLSDSQQQKKKKKSELFNSIWAKVNEDCMRPHLINPKQCIYRVPDKLRKLKEDAYSPRLVSIGPLHMDDSHLKGMEKHKEHKGMEDHKEHYMHRLFRRTIKSDHTETDDLCQTIRSCVDAMMEAADSAKDCYEQSFDHDKFAEIMLVDGCFILELLYKSQEREDKTFDPIFDNASVLFQIKHDLLLPENQIPFSVLEKLFQHTVKNIPNPPPTNPHSLPEYILRFFGNMMNLECDISKKAVVRGDHILDTLHKRYLPERWEANKIKNDDLEAGEGKDQEDMESKPSPANEPAGHPALKYRATELDRAGVKFQAGERGVLDMSFNKSIFSWLCAIIPKQFSSCFFYCCGTTTFQISPFWIDDSTETFLMNLIAYEQSNSSVPQHVTSYAVLMKTLLNSKDDVQVLVKAKVLQNYEGVSEVALQLFKNVCKNVVPPVEDLYFSKSCKDLDDHLSKFRTGNLPSKLKRNYVSMVNYFFSSRWKAISIIGALILFALQVLQTVYTI